MGRGKPSNGKATLQEGEKQNEMGDKMTVRSGVKRKGEKGRGSGGLTAYVR